MYLKDDVLTVYESSILKNYNAFPIEPHIVGYLTNRNYKSLKVKLHKSRGHTILYTISVDDLKKHMRTLPSNGVDVVPRTAFKLVSAKVVGNSLLNEFMED